MAGEKWVLVPTDLAEQAQHALSASEFPDDRCVAAEFSAMLSAAPTCNESLQVPAPSAPVTVEEIRRQAFREAAGVAKQFAKNADFGSDFECAHGIATAIEALAEKE